MFFMAVDYCFRLILLALAIPEYYFIAIVSISIRAPRGISLTAKADLAGGFEG